MSNEEARNIYNMVGLRTGCCQITELVEKYERLENENKELKERIKADERANLILANDNKMLRRSKKNAYQEFKKKHNSLYKQRIDNAIEYIKKNEYEKLGGGYGCIINCILEILEGDK